jgi:hypothetical protein
MLFRWFCLALILLPLAVFAAPEDYFGIQVVDETTGRGVPLVTLRTTNQIMLTTDSAGWIAFDEPGLMNRTVYFNVEGPGYALPKDGFGYAGVKLTPVAGKTAQVKVLRTNIAERLCRLTGQGIYRDSKLAGKGAAAAASEPVRGCDGPGLRAGGAVERALLLDLRRHVSGRTIRWEIFIPPPHGVMRRTRAAWILSTASTFEYVTDENDAVAKMLPVEEPGVVWLFGMLTVMDAEKHEHLIAHYSRWRDLGKRLEHGSRRWMRSDRTFPPHRRAGGRVTVAASAATTPCG